MSQDEWQDGKCKVCNRSLIFTDVNWCPRSSGDNCRAYVREKTDDPNHDNHPLAQAFSRSLKEWLDAGASLSSLLQTLEEECWARKERILTGDTSIKGSADDWEKAAEEFFELNEPEGLT
jgi:hypothetical protein